MNMSIHDSEIAESPDKNLDHRSQASLQDSTISNADWNAIAKEIKDNDKVDNLLGRLQITADIPSARTKLEATVDSALKDFKAFPSKETRNACSNALDALATKMYETAGSHKEGIDALRDFALKRGLSFNLDKEGGANVMSDRTTLIRFVPESPKKDAPIQTYDDAARFLLKQCQDKFTQESVKKLATSLDNLSNKVYGEAKTHEEGMRAVKETLEKIPGVHVGSQPDGSFILGIKRGDKIAPITSLVPDNLKSDAPQKIVQAHTAIQISNAFKEKAGAELNAEITRATTAMLDRATANMALTPESLQKYVSDAALEGVKIEIASANSGEMKLKVSSTTPKNGKLPPPVEVNYTVKKAPRL